MPPEALLEMRPDRPDDPIMGLYMAQPYEPGKIPVLLVHGLWSSPMTWMEMFNDLRAQPEIRKHFQFWFYLYPTGQPFWISAAQLLRDLAEARQTLDPFRQEPSLDQIVLIGHSMGGLVSRLQTINSRNDFWSLASAEPFDRIQAEPDVQHIPWVALDGALAVICTGITDVSGIDVARFHWHPVGNPAAGDSVDMINLTGDVWAADILREDHVSPNTEIKVVQDRSENTPTPGGGGGSSGDDNDEDRQKMYTYILIGALIIGGLGGAYWVYSRRQNETQNYLTHYY